MRAIRVTQFGGPDELRLEELPPPSPGPGQAVIRIGAAGLNYIDVYHRTGLYPNRLPFTPGQEGAGEVVEVGPQVTDFKKGDTVAWSGILGSYAELLLAPTGQLVPCPAGIDPRTAAAAMLQGMTAHYLSDSTYPLKPGDTCLIHAAAGGVGLLLAQMAKKRGARVVGTVSTEEKAALAREAGCDLVVRYTEQDFLEEVKRFTGGRGVNVVYDSVGQTTFEKSLDCLAPRGLLVLFGQSSGPVPSFNLGLLSQKGSLFLTRPSLAHYVPDPESLRGRAGVVLKAITEGTLKLRIERTFPLAEAAEAHRTLEGRKTTGKVLLLP
jgi:NADPH2:quinone reductase